MPRSTTIAATLITIATIAVVFSLKDTAVPTSPSSPPIQSIHPSHTTIGEEILAAYADPNKPPSHDLELADRLLFSYRTLVKNHADKPVGTNADFVDALLGDNPAKQVFLPKNSPHIDAGGQLLDRWRTPLFIHPESSERITLRSAGPDRTMWTDDDIVHQPR